MLLNRAKSIAEYLGYAGEGQLDKSGFYVLAAERPSFAKAPFGVTSFCNRNLGPATGWLGTSLTCGFDFYEFEDRVQGGVVDFSLWGLMRP